MTTEFIERQFSLSAYRHKEGTNSTYVFQSGELLLPKNIYIIRGEASMGLVKNTGRGMLPKVGTLKGRFTQGEHSKYKESQPYKVQTSLWRIEGRQSLFYGTIGISGMDGKISCDYGDLLLLRELNWMELLIFIFRGFASKDSQQAYLNDAIGFLKDKGLLDSIVSKF